ncbi:hypothetical protein MBLNU457_6390t1 [Dothideomycetes sp. NU457]
MPIVDLFHAYCYGSAFWYTLRGFCRVYDPKMVVGWFRPPVEAQLMVNDLELYNVRTDAWGLITIAIILVIISGTLPLPGAMKKYSSSLKDAAATQPLAKAIVAADVFHHVMTGLGAWSHFSRETHYNASMAVGVYGCAGLALFGLATLLAPPELSGLGGGASEKEKKAM